MSNMLQVAAPAANNNKRLRLADAVRDLHEELEIHEPHSSRAALLEERMQDYARRSVAGMDVEDVLLEAAHVPVLRRTVRESRSMSRAADHAELVRKLAETCSRMAAAVAATTTEDMDPEMQQSLLRAFVDMQRVCAAAEQAMACGNMTPLGSGKYVHAIRTVLGSGGREDLFAFWNRMNTDVKPLDLMKAPRPRG